MANIYVEGKGPQGPQIKESLKPTAVTGYSRGLCVNYGADAFTAVLIAAAAVSALGILEEDAVSTSNPVSVVEFGQTVAQIGASVSKGNSLATNASGQLVPATTGQLVVAIALEDQTYVSPGSFATVFFFGAFAYPQPQAPPTQYTASGAIAIASGVVELNGAAALAMTLAAPTAGQDGTKMTIVAYTAHAHTVTTPANKINGNKDTVTFAAVGDNIELLAVNGIWAVVAVNGPTPASLSEV